MGRRFVHAAILCCITFAVHSQQYSLRQYTVLDGLPQSQVNMVLEDKNGYLWIGTHGGGLARYDGREFKVYTTRDGLLSNIVHYLKLDSKQNLWIVHPVGITRFDGVNFFSFQPQAATASARRVRRVFEMNDSIFFMTNQRTLGMIHHDSVYYWDRPVLKDKMVLYTHLLPTRDIALYLSDSSFLIKAPNLEYQVKYKEHFSRVINMFNVRDEVWVNTDRGYFVFDYQQKTFTRKAAEVVNHVVQYDSSRQVFWTRHDNNLMREYWVNDVHKTDTVLRDINITQVFIDSEGNTWFGSSGNGLYKYFVQDFDRCASKTLTQVYAIQKDKDGASWIGSGNQGLWQIHKGKVRKFDVGDVTENGITSIALSPAGDVWMGAFGGLGKYKKETDNIHWYTRSDGVPSPYVNQIDFDGEGKLWCATSGGGVACFDNGVFKGISEEQGLQSRNALSIRYMPFNNLVYVGTDNGLHLIRNGNAYPVAIAELENSPIYSISVYKKEFLLLGTGGAGVIVYHPSTHQRSLIDTHVGLPSDFIYFAGVDAEERIWIGTEKGISKIKLNDQLGIAEILHYGFDNGLAGLETNYNAYYLGDEKYFGLKDGIYQYNDLRNEDWHSFPVHLTDVEIFNGQYSSRQFSKMQTGFFKVPVNPNMPSDKNHITLRFNRVDKRYPKSVRYQYFLKGWDKTWSIPSATNYVTYGNLPPGDYEFQLKATNNQGSWDEAPVNYAFTIEAPFYQTAAFQVVIGVIVAGLFGLYLFYRVRSRFNKIVELQQIRQQEQDNLRKEIARDFHDEMGNQLTRIINYISLMKLNGNGHTSDLYNKVEESAKYLYTGTRDFIWSIDPVNDELYKLFIHIRDFGEKLFSEKEINFRAFNEVKEKKVTVPYGFSREANLIFKEAMTNSFNHSQAKNVSFTLRQDGDQFEMILEDDGKGFNQNELARINGLKNMKNRADRIGARLDIKSAFQQGVAIQLIFSINKKTTSYELSV